MATSRTGTAAWKKLRAKALRISQARGQTTCPYCGTWLDYVVSLKPNSAEVDHVVAHARGGQDVLANTQIICRKCNGSKSNRSAPKTSTVLAAKPLKTSRRW